MKVVFFKGVEGTAQIGDVKEVKPGFARNYLLPRGLAGPTTRDTMQHALSLAEREKRIQVKLDAEAEVVAAPLEGAQISVEARVGDTGQLFGSITTRDIVGNLKETHGVEVDPHSVLLFEPIRELGSKDVAIRFTRNITATITVNVEPDEASKEIVERLAAEAEAERVEAEKREAELAYAERQRAPQSDEHTAPTESDVEAETGEESSAETSEDSAT